MLQIPRPLEPGTTRTGTSEAKAADGSVKRTEDWTVTVLGTERITVAGGAVDAHKVKVERKSRPGSPDQVVRTRTYWFDPARAIWVKFTEDFRGERKTAGFTFAYQARISATLVEFAPQR